MTEFSIDGRTIGEGHPCFVLGELGINHQGSLDIAKRLVDACHEAGVEAVKTQKRTVDVVYTAAELAQPRPGPWGATNGDLKRLLEFSPMQCRDLDAHALSHGMTWSASPWDVQSVADLGTLGVEWVKVASASITDEPLVRACASMGVPVIMSTGMSSTAEIDQAVEWVTSSTACPALALLHTCSAYPSAVEDLHLHRIAWLRERYGCVVGYSGHESGVLPSVEAVRLGASIVERHVTLDRTMWGSDQAASLEPGGLRILVRAIRELEAMRARGYDDEHSAADAVALAEIGEVMRKQARNRSVARTAQGVAGERTVLASEAGPRAKLRKA
jgi:N-acetylneuraminate synthase